MERYKGAEAVLEECEFAGTPALRKIRLQKKYRPGMLDVKIRGSRTKIEARLLHKAKLAGVECPHVLEVLPYSIAMTKEDGEMLHEKIKKNKKIANSAWKLAGIFLARLHFAKIIHGDYTPANLMLDGKGRLTVIDFGLGGISNDSEDYAVDVLTMKKALSDAKARKAFLAGYGSEEMKLGGKKPVLHLVDEMEKRGRYRERGE